MNFQFLEPNQHWVVATLKAIVMGVLLTLMGAAVIFGTLSAITKVVYGADDVSIEEQHDPNTYDQMLDLMIISGDYSGMQSYQDLEAEAEIEALREELIKRGLALAKIAAMAEEMEKDKERKELAKAIAEALKEAEDDNDN